MSSFRPLIAGKNSLFPEAFPERYGGGGGALKMRRQCAKIAESLFAVRARKEGRADWWRIGHGCPEIADQSLAINGAHHMIPNREYGLPIIGVFRAR